MLSSRLINSLLTVLFLGWILLAARAAGAQDIARQVAAAPTLHSANCLDLDRGALRRKIGRFHRAGFERGGNTLARVTRHQAALTRLLDVAERIPRETGSSLDDPVVRQKLGQMIVEVEVLRYAGLRILSKLEQGQRP